MQNDQRNCRKVFKRVLANDSLEKLWKTLFFAISCLFVVLCWGHNTLDFSKRLSLKIQEQLKKVLVFLLFFRYGLFQLAKPPPAPPS